MKIGTNKEYTAEMKLSHNAKRVLNHLRTEWRFDDGGSSWYSFVTLAKELRLSLFETRRAVYELRDVGAVYYTWLCDDEQRPHGSGYILGRWRSVWNTHHRYVGYCLR